MGDSEKHLFSKKNHVSSVFVAPGSWQSNKMAHSPASKSQKSPNIEKWGRAFFHPRLHLQCLQNLNHHNPRVGEGLKNTKNTNKTTTCPFRPVSAKDVQLWACLQLWGGPFLRLSIGFSTLTSMNAGSTQLGTGNKNSLGAITTPHS